MGSCCTLSVLSDIHYAGRAECETGHQIMAGVHNPLVYALLKIYRHFIWMRNPFVHNHLLDRFLESTGQPNHVIANGDYCCNNNYVGVSDDGACESAQACLNKLRSRFGTRFLCICGDHELGKKKIGSNLGGLRLASYHRARQNLGIEPFWQLNLGNYVLLGVVSSLVALPIFESEALPAERPEWHELQRVHLKSISQAFAQLKPDQRLLLFCHDPTALPFLYQLDAVRAKLAQIEYTVIGHLHSRLVLWQSQFLGRIPRLNFGYTSRRITTALRQVRNWKHFKPLLCPALAGIQLLKDGGFYTAELDLAARQPAHFTFHPLPW